MPKSRRTRTKEEKIKAHNKLKDNQLKKFGRVIPVMLFLFIFSFIPVFATTFEGVGATTTNAIDMLDGTYLCSNSEALNYLELSNEANACIYTPPTMQELIVINTTIIAFACMVWLSRLFIDVNPKTNKK